MHPPPPTTNTAAPDAPPVGAVDTSAHETATRPPLSRGSAFAGLFAVLVLVLGRVFPHSEHLQAIALPCPLKLASGVPCATCGATRVSVLLAHGDLFDALSLAPLPTLVLLVFLAVGLDALVAFWRRRPGPDAAMAWLFVTTPGRLLLGGSLLGLYAYTLWRFTETGLP